MKLKKRLKYTVGAGALICGGLFLTNPSFAWNLGDIGSPSEWKIPAPPIPPPPSKWQLDDGTRQNLDGAADAWRQIQNATDGSNIKGGGNNTPSSPVPTRTAQVGNLPCLDGADNQYAPGTFACVSPPHWWWCTGNHSGASDIPQGSWEVTNTPCNQSPHR